MIGSVVSTGTYVYLSSHDFCSYLSNVIIKYQPQVLACSVIQMTADTLNHNLRTNPPWFELLDTSLQDMTQVMDTMKRIYDLSPADFRQLPWTRRELQTYLRSK